ncbi:MAG: energy transducer TonB [Bacteroidaceae bacterium]|nr:energy transducer TonB [Bacteroidaceae bacterium]
MEEVIVPEAPEQAVQDDDDKNPLVLVNGVEIEFPVDIKTLTGETIAQALGIKEEDIESITVIKDAAATTIFGDKGKNGVIQITVKKDSQFPDQSPKEILEKLPGVQKNNDGSYSVNGKKVQKILVNGREYYKAVGDDQEKLAIEDAEIPTIQNAIHDDPIFEVVEEPAQYPGGQAALMQYLAQNIRYPKISAENGVQGRILVQFVIEKDGSLSNFKIVKDAKPVSDGITANAQGTAAEGNNIPQEAYGALNIEALRVLRGMPNWTPAKQRGQVVRLKYTLPVTFRLQ